MQYHPNIFPRPLLPVKGADGAGNPEGRVRNPA